MLLEKSVWIKCRKKRRNVEKRIEYRVLFGVRPRNETAKSKERYAGRSITRISKKVQWTGHRSTIMIRALHMQYQIVTVNRIRWRRVLFHADGTNEKKWRSRWRQMIRGTRLDLLKVTETNQQNESNVSTERWQHVKFINARTAISFRYNRCFSVDDFACSFPYRVNNIDQLISIPKFSLNWQIFLSLRKLISQIWNFQCIISIELIRDLNFQDDYKIGSWRLEWMKD